jgi:hypothetical protein
VRFQAVTVAIMTMAVFWIVVPCCLVPDNGGSKHLWNVGGLVPDYTAQQPRRQPSSIGTVDCFCTVNLLRAPRKQRVRNRDTVGRYFNMRWNRKRKKEIAGNVRSTCLFVANHTQSWGDKNETWVWFTYSAHFMERFKCHNKFMYANK